MAPTKSAWLGLQRAKHPTNLSKAALRNQMRRRLRVELAALVVAVRHQSQEIARIRHFLDDTHQDEKDEEEEGDEDDVVELDGNNFPPPPPPPSAGHPPTIAIGK